MSQQSAAAVTKTLPAWLSIATWITLGTCMIMFNKVLLTTWRFNYPCLLTTWHCVVTTILTQILSRTSNMLSSVQKGVVTGSEYSIRILPMAVCFACALVTGNMAYQYISLAYIQMIKAFTPVPLLLLSFVSGLERPSLVLFVIVLVVSAGVTLSSVGELAFSATGFLLQLTAVLMDCFRVILMSLLLKDLQLDSLSLLYYTAPPSAVLTFCAFLALEADRLSWDIFTPTLCGALLLSGLLAFSLNVAVVFLVGTTNSMAMSLSGPLKDILIVLLSVVLLRAPITFLQVVGFAVSLTGLHLYREHKSDPKKLANMLGLCAPKEGNSNNSTNSSTSTATVQSAPNQCRL